MMKIFLCSKNEGIVSRIKETLSGMYDDIQVCTQGSSSRDSLGSLIQLLQDEYVILYHLTADQEDEKSLYKFLSENEGAKEKVAKRMLVLVNTPDNDQGIRLLFAGVHGYANVYLNPEKLKSAVHVVEQGEIWAGEEILMKLLMRNPNPSMGYRKDSQLNDALSNREKQIVDVVLQGKTNKQVAIKLNITERTVKAHLSSIFQKTKTRNRFELTVKLKSL